LRPFDGNLTEADLVVDALFGIGLKHAPDGVYADLISAMNAQAAPILALDVPSSVDADTENARVGRIGAARSASS
jgi:NAD(P)H-hydrate epimerase